MSRVFGADYAQAYDAMYADKDYEAECDLIEVLLRTHSGATPQRILDLGCGTGGHAIPLTQRGHDATGVDISTSMLERARHKPGGDAVRFVHGDIRNVTVESEFDACLIMFATLGYMESMGDVLATLRTARRGLRSGGMLFVEVWWANAVFTQRPSLRERELVTAGSRLIRRAVGRLDEERRVCVIDIEVIWETASSCRTSREQHTVRYFDGEELQELLSQAGFALLRLGGFPDIGADPDNSTWSVMAVARAV